MKSMRSLKIATGQAIAIEMVVQPLNRIFRPGDDRERGRINCRKRESAVCLKQWPKGTFRKRNGQHCAARKLLHQLPSRRNKRQSIAERKDACEARRNILSNAVT